MSLSGEKGLRSVENSFRDLGNFEFLVMPFGFTNALAVSQS